CALPIWAAADSHLTDRAGSRGVGLLWRACGSEPRVLVVRRPTQNSEDSGGASAPRTERLLLMFPLTRILRLASLIGVAAVVVGSLAPAQSGVMHLIDQGGI